MTSLMYVISEIAAPSGRHLKLICNSQKRDSIPRSEFQMLGLLYNLVDALVRYDCEARQQAIDFFVGSLCERGWSERIAEKLLAAQNWKIRMYTAWIFTGEWDRNEAVALDYKEFQNFWPDTKFCKSNWGDEVREWNQDHTRHAVTELPLISSAWFDMSNPSISDNVLA